MLLNGINVHMAKSISIRKGEPVNSSNIAKALNLPVFVKRN